MSETYADDYERETVGGFIVVAISILSAILVLAGLFYATGAHARNKTALALNDCEPSLSPSGLPCNTQADGDRPVQGNREPGQQAADR